MRIRIRIRNPGYNTVIYPKTTTGLAEKFQINEEGFSWKIKNNAFNVIVFSHFYIGNLYLQFQLPDLQYCALPNVARGASLRQYIGAEIPFFFYWLHSCIIPCPSILSYPRLLLSPFSISFPILISHTNSIFLTITISLQRTTGEAHRTILRAWPIDNEVAYRFCSTDRNRKYAF
jgi:hypothetical protein